MLTPKKCIDKTMQKIIKQLKVPKYIRNHLVCEADRIGNELCYCVLLDNVTVCNLPIEVFYTQPISIIKKRIDLDLEKHILKVYAKELKT